MFSFLTRSSNVNTTALLNTNELSLSNRTPIYGQLHQMLSSSLSYCVHVCTTSSPCLRCAVVLTMNAASPSNVLDLDHNDGGALAREYILPALLAAQSVAVRQLFAAAAILWAGNKHGMQQEKIMKLSITMNIMLPRVIVSP